MDKLNTHIVNRLSILKVDLKTWRISGGNYHLILLFCNQTLLADVSIGGGKLDVYKMHTF